MACFWDLRFEKKKKTQCWIFKSGLKGCAVHPTQFAKGLHCCHQHLDYLHRRESASTQLVPTCSGNGQICTSS